MNRLVALSVLALLTLSSAPRGAGAACDSPGDLADLAAVRDLVAQQCDCASAPSSRVYIRCATAVANVAIATGRLSPLCRSAVSRCAAKSTCGRPGAVTCCRVTASGRKKCVVKSSAASCQPPRGGTACVGTLSSCCDACDPSGGCVAPTTTTTSSTTTTTTTPPSLCGNGIRNPGEQCDGTDFGGATCPGGSAGGAFLVCRPDCTIDFSHCGGTPTTSTTATTAPAPTTTVTSTTTTSTSTTTSTLPDVDCRDPLLHLPPLVKLPITSIPASASCGGAHLVPAPTSPFSAELFDGAGRSIADLGTNCLYIGEGNSSLVPFQVPDDTELVLNVVGLRGFTAIAGPSAGSGKSDCSLGAGPGKHCLNGSPGRGQGVCLFDSDCGGGAGSCGLDANCFFGPPLQITTPVNACAVPVALTDFCGEANLATFAINVRGALSARVYLSSCPACVSHVCQGGANNGQHCTAAENGTSVDCLPTANTFVGAFVAAPTLSTEPLSLSDSAGLLCAGQQSPGAFGLPNARRLRTDGRRFSLLGLQTTLAGPFCALQSGNPTLDAVVGLPAPGAATLKGRVDLIALLRLFGL